MSYYEQLNDLVLDYIAGNTPQNEGRGLGNLTDITLPKRSFVTELGFRSLLENLKRLENIKHPGKMARAFAESSFNEELLGV